MAKQAEDGYLAEVFGNAARHLVMAEDVLRSPERGAVGIEAASSMGKGGAGE
jgi:hypothetical protein